MTRDEAALMCKTIAETIMWLTDERMKEGHFHDSNSALLSTFGDIRLHLRYKNKAEIRKEINERAIQTKTQRRDPTGSV